MTKLTTVLLVVALAGGLAGPARAQQADRRDRKDPELVVESGGRRGACDVLTFTRDGRRLLAVGDDKVVRIWRASADGLEPDDPPVLRWSAWREQRGAIHALALSPDPEARRVAIGGLGPRYSSVAVLDRATGTVLHAVAPEAGRDKDSGRSENFYGVTALAFAPSGKRLAYGTADGSVWVWDFKVNRRLGKPASTGSSSGRGRRRPSTGSATSTSPPRTSCFPWPRTATWSAGTSPPVAPPARRTKPCSRANTPSSASP
jgi:WD40 repeat protein